MYFDIKSSGHIKTAAITNFSLFFNERNEHAKVFNKQCSTILLKSRKKYNTIYIQNLVIINLQSGLQPRLSHIVHVVCDTFIVSGTTL